MSVVYQITLYSLSVLVVEMIHAFSSGASSAYSAHTLSNTSSSGLTPQRSDDSTVSVDDTQSIAVETPGITVSLTGEAVSLSSASSANAQAAAQGRVGDVTASDSSQAADSSTQSDDSDAEIVPSSSSSDFDGDVAGGVAQEYTTTSGAFTTLSSAVGSGSAGAALNVLV